MKPTRSVIDSVLALYKQLCGAKDINYDGAVQLVSNGPKEFTIRSRRRPVDRRQRPQSPVRRLQFAITRRILQSPPASADKRPGL